MNIQRLDTSDTEFWSKLDKRLAWDSASDKSVFDTVNGILADVKSRGDKAVVEYTNKFDRMHTDTMQELEITPERLQQALESITPVLIH
jgi:histidinol dehydrogenase